MAKADPLFSAAVQAHQAGRFGEAEQMYLRVLRQTPRHADALHLLGVVAAQTGRPKEAIASIKRAIAIAPKAGVYHANLGNAYQDCDQTRDALAANQKAAALDPRDVGAMNGLGTALRKLDELQAAENAFRRAVELAPATAAFHANLGNVLESRGQYQAAREAYDKAVRLSPNSAEHQWGLALQELRLGDYANGWNRYEWRWQMASYKVPRWNRPEPLWDGSDLAGRTILLHMEQGYGDNVQLIRYVPLVKARGGGIMMTTLDPLLRLFRTIPEADAVYRETEPVPPFEVHAPLMSLPRIFKTTVETIPATVPYLHLAPADVAAWAERISAMGPGLKVGLCWAGKPSHGNDRNRSMSLATLNPLATVGGVHFLRLHKGPSPQSRECDLKPLDCTADLADFADTASLVMNLDLVITVDTSIAHLAGALGKPTWLLLPFVADWRWLLDRTDSPWYPTIRLYRQSTPGDWKSVVERVGNDLKAKMIGAPFNS